MGVNNVILFPLVSLIITLGVGIMIGWEIGIASGALAALVCLFTQASQPNASPLYLIGCIIFSIIFFLLGGDSLRRILGVQKFRERLTELTTLRQRGVELLNKGFNNIRNDTEKDKWWQEIEIWRNNVCSIMRKIHSADPDNWEILGTFHARFFNLYSNDMNHKVTQLSAWLEKLREYIDDRAKK